jgi:hypothetical protein
MKRTDQDWQAAYAVDPDILCDKQRKCRYGQHIVGHGSSDVSVGTNRFGPVMRLPRFPMSSANGLPRDCPRDTRPAAQRSEIGEGSPRQLLDKGGT